MLMLMRVTSVAVLLVFTLVSFPTLSQGQGHDHILAGEEEPVLIQEFESEGDLSNGGRVSFEATYVNLTSDTVEAVRFGLASFGPFSDLVGYSTWTEIQRVAPYGLSKEQAEVGVYFSTGQQHRHYFGFIYIDRVRMKGGKFWRTDPDSVQRRMRQILDAPDLTLPVDTLELEQEQKI